MGLGAAHAVLARHAVGSQLGVGELGLAEGERVAAVVGLGDGPATCEVTVRHSLSEAGKRTACRPGFKLSILSPIRTSDVDRLCPSISTGRWDCGF